MELISYKFFTTTVMEVLKLECRQGIIEQVQMRCSTGQDISIFCDGFPGIYAINCTYTLLQRCAISNQITNDLNFSSDLMSCIGLEINPIYSHCRCSFNISLGSFNLMTSNSISFQVLSQVYNSSGLSIEFLPHYLESYAILIRIIFSFTSIWVLWILVFSLRKLSKFRKKRKWI
jgi:hypothetical protein